MTKSMIPHNALNVVADVNGARLFRNAGKDFKVSLVPEGEREVGKTLTKASIADIAKTLN